MSDDRGRTIAALVRGGLTPTQALRATDPPRVRRDRPNPAPMPTTPKPAIRVVGQGRRRGGFVKGTAHPHNIEAYRQAQLEERLLHSATRPSPNVANLATLGVPHNAPRFAWARDVPAWREHHPVRFVYGTTNSNPDHLAKLEAIIDAQPSGDPRTHYRPTPPPDRLDTEPTLLPDDAPERALVVAAIVIAITAPLASLASIPEIGTAPALLITALLTIPSAMLWHTAREAIADQAHIEANP